MRFKILFIGDGKAQVTKHGTEGSPFSDPGYDADKRRFVPDYVPGYVGLSFDADKWRDFTQSAERHRLTVMEFTYPEWTCDEYDIWRRKQGLEILTE